jgi:hypothetical protein
VHAGLTLGFSFHQEFPNRKHDKNGQSDSVADHTGLADFFLFDHAILLYVLQPLALPGCALLREN